MEDHHDNLGDFFKKKLSDLDLNDEQWVQPDPGVREQVLSNISLTSVSWVVISKLAFKIIVSFVLLGSLSYAYYSHMKVKKMEKQLKEEQLFRVQLSDTMTKLMTQLEEEKTEIAHLRRKTENMAIELQKRQDWEEDYIAQQKYTMGAIQKENTELKQILQQVTSLSDKQNDPLLKDTQQVILTENKWVDSLDIFPSLATDIPLITLNPFKTQLPTENAISKIEPIKQLPKYRFEVGYEWTLGQLEMPIHFQYEHQRIVSGEEHTIEQVISWHGLQLGYRVLPNWWITAGLRFSQAELQSKTSLAISYNPFNQRSDNNGNSFNALSLNTSMPHSAARTNALLILPRSSVLEGGDLLENEIEINYNLDLLQMPFGISYINQAQRMSWLLQAGVQWNRIEVSSFNINNSFQARNEDILSAREFVEEMSASNEDFFTAYAALGLGYRLITDWHIRGSLNYNHHLFQANGSEQSSFTSFRPTFRLGLHYKF